ncbi:MAG TPA: glycosyltransferase [Thermoanaerobaculia bacterium]|nr:glycosyltransferase [Thermoanaerobaculia bacterium]
MLSSQVDAGGTPRVSVVIPVYESQATLERCLDGLARQTFTGFEVVAVDSSPGEASHEVLRRHPEVRAIRSRLRMLPQEARRRAIEAARGELLVSIDPDVYPHREWLERLVAAHDEGGRPAVVGALACHGRRWLDTGIHLCKFSKWLPGRSVTGVDVGPSANLLVDRDAFEDAGGFSGDAFFGDATLSWTLTGDRRGLPFAADAVVDHHHLSTFGEFVSERYRRGVEFGRLRLSWRGAGRARALGLLVVTALPLRLASNLLHVARHAADAGQLGSLAATSPVVFAGVAASLAGEAVGYARALVTPPAPAWAATR